MREQRFLEDSKIFYLQQDGSASPDIQFLPTHNDPSELPSLLLDRSGTVHFLWGARRQDPDFDEWKTERPQFLGFSTDAIYSRYDGTRFTPPEVIYEGHLRELVGGTGDILFPAKWVEDSQGRLHTVFIADSVRTITNQDGEEIVSFAPGVVYMSSSTMLEWRKHSILEPAALSDLTIVDKDRLAVSYLGSVEGPRSINDVLVITSDDGGSSWSEPKMVFFSGIQPGRMLSLKTGPEGRVHLIWGRQTRNLPIANELWHSWSEDAAQSWSAPERFFQPIQSAEVENVIDSFDMVIDSSGRVHWAAVELRVQGVQGTLYYGTWEPESQTWNTAEFRLTDTNSRRVDLAIDEAAGKIYLFWENADENAIYYSTMEPQMANIPPVVAKSGPLQLHANYPNPFSPSTRISFTLEEPADVVLTVYDISGRRVLQKDLGTNSAGLHSEEVNMEGLTSGTYIYEVELDNRWRQQSTMMLIK